MTSPIETEKEINQIDIIAIWISFACLAHCLLLPITYSLLPFLGEFDRNDIVHKSLVFVALPTSAYALWRSGGWQITYLLVLAILGLSLLAIAAFIPSFHDFETPISVVGAVVLAFVHYKNVRLHQCKSNRCAH